MNELEKLEKLKRVEKKLLKTLIGLGFIAIVGIILLIWLSKENNVSIEDGESIPENSGLDDSTSLLPGNCNLNEAIPNFSFSTESGELLSIQDFKGKITIVTFWASWCPDCTEEMPLVNDFLELTQKYENVDYILINKLDNERETKEKAKQYLLDEGIKVDTYYDDGLGAYQMLDMHNIPTTYFIDEEGILRAWCPKQITDISVFEAYLLNTIKGSGTVTGEFVANYMTDEAGGVHSSYSTSNEITVKSDILSESQGAMLEYAVLKQNKELFDKILNYINSMMWKDGMTSWIVSDGVASETNALIDDFRIYTSLIGANKIWGGYEEVITKYETAFAKYAVNENQYVDFYDGKSKTYASRFTLCFGDLSAMSILAEKDENLKIAYDNAVLLVTEGMISDEFPLFYSWYNYNTKKYEKDEMNAAEAMVTFLHLAQVDMLPQESINWLKSEMAYEGIKARYTVEGQVVTGYNYDSTAVYALVAMIAEEIGDDDLRGEALKKMEKMRINNTDFEYNGSFGLEDGTGILSFDQIMAMLAYEYTYRN